MKRTAHDVHFEAVTQADTRVKMSFFTILQAHDYGLRRVNMSVYCVYPRMLGIPQHVLDELER